MNSRSDEDFELELRSIPGVVAVAVERDDAGLAFSVTLHDAGTQHQRTETLAKQILSFYYPQAKLKVEPLALVSEQSHRPPRVIIERADALEDGGAEVRLTWTGPWSLIGDVVGGEVPAAPAGSRVALPLIEA